MQSMYNASSLRIAPHEFLGDGTHGGDDTQAGVRWWLEIVPGTLAPVLTLQFGGLRQFERPGATAANVGPLIDVIVADLAARHVKKARRKGTAG